MPSHVISCNRKFQHDTRFDLVSDTTTTLFNCTLTVNIIYPNNTPNRSFFLPIKARQKE